MLKSGIQMMFEQMIGEQGMEAIEKCKQLLPSVPVLIDTIKRSIDTIKREWEVTRKEQQEQRRLLERIAIQNELILGGLQQLGYKIDPTKADELPPTLAHHLSVQENAERYVYESCDHCMGQHKTEDCQSYMRH